MSSYNFFVALRDHSDQADANGAGSAKYAVTSVRHTFVWELALLAHCCAIQPYILKHPQLRARMLAACNVEAQAAICREGEFSYSYTIWSQCLLLHMRVIPIPWGA